MTASSSDIATGAAALRAYVQTIDGWEASFVPDNVYSQGSQEVLAVLDAVPPPAPPASKPAGNALFLSITNAGYGDQVTLDQCVAAAQAVINAVLAARGPQKETTS